MANNSIGQLRRSAVVSTFGPGAIVDYRASGAPISAVTAGLEEWDRDTHTKGITHAQTIFEPRLQARLNVSGFRLPPVDIEEANTKDIVLPAVRFPQWLQCPECHALKPAGKWG